MIPRTQPSLVGLIIGLVTMGGLSSEISAQAQTNADVMRHTPHFEITGGIITGDRVGASFESSTGGLVGGGLVFPVVKRLDLRAQYLYSNQDRRFVAFPGTQELPGSIMLTASSLHVMMGTADVALRNWEKGELYFSPGAGVMRNAARDWNPAGNAPFASLGIGYWACASERLGVRFELRHFVSGGGTGEIWLVYPAVIGFPRPTLAKMPVQNNVTFTVSFTLRLR